MARPRIIPASSRSRTTRSSLNFNSNSTSSFSSSCSQSNPRPPFCSSFPVPLLILNLILITFFSTLFPTTLAVKFIIEAHHDPVPKCLWNYAMTDTLVVISVSAPMTGISSLQRLDMEILDGSGSRNVYQSKKGLKGETRMAVTTHADADLGICFKNVLDPSVPESQASKHFRSIDLDVDIGADAVDYNAIAKQESLSGLEVEMRKLEGVVKEIVEELNYLKRREARMRDTNESTNDRVRNFFFMTFALLILLGVWQILHLRSYFKKKYLID